MDETPREALSRRKMALFTAAHGVLPPFHEVTMWATRGSLINQGRADRMLLAQEVKRR